MSIPRALPDLFSREYATIFCGGGPATVGAMLSAARTGRLDELLNRGVLVLEADKVGPGRLPRYGIHANSLGRAFLECLDVMDDLGFESLRHADETLQLKALADEHPPLSVVARFLERVGACLVSILDSHPACGVLQKAHVQGVEILPGGRAEIAFRRGSSPTPTLVVGRRVVLAMGGRPLHSEGPVEIVPGLSLNMGETKVIDADELLLAESRTSVVEGLPPDAKLVVVGGAHSAWSSASVLLNSSGTLIHSGLQKITVMHRGPLRLFYNSEDEALRDKYHFTQSDVCPLSGRVNRYGGLRGTAKSLALRAIRGETSNSPIRTLQVGSHDEASMSSAREALDAADAIVLATGYRANLPVLRNNEGRIFHADLTATGTRATPSLRLIDREGHQYPELIVYGLGAGPVASDSVGGEPSYRRRADGVWLYQNDIGDRVINELLATEFPIAKENQYS